MIKSTLFRICSREATSVHRSLSSLPFKPRRSLMYVPGNDERKVGKIPELGADCVCLDCEDGVAVNMKETARLNIRSILDSQNINFGKVRISIFNIIYCIVRIVLKNNVVSKFLIKYFLQSECSVRVNGVESGLCEEDLKTVLGGHNLPSSIHLPKVKDREELEFVWNVVESVVGPGRGSMGLIMFIETARSLLDVDKICSDAWELAARPGSVLCPVALVFGSDDFAADVGATRTKSNVELMLARQMVVTAAKAHKLQAIDAVYIDYRDSEGLRRQSEEGAGWGFTGKQVIHPGQIEIVQSAFTPSRERLEWARQLMQAWHHHQSTGQGAFTFRGHMIDMPTVKQAQNVIDTHDQTS